MKPGEYVTSDHHFGHRNIIQYCDRPFKGINHMDEFMIARWNERVPKGAIVYHLGDLSLHSARYVHRLNGRIRLVLGNHDKIRGGDRDKFDWIKSYYESKTVDGIKVVMCHYPFHTWNASHHGSWHLHGHCHGTVDGGKYNRLDVGVDAHQFIPLSYYQVRSIMEKKGQLTEHHHDL